MKTQSTFEAGIGLLLAIAISLAALFISGSIPQAAFGSTVNSVAYTVANGEKTSPERAMVMIKSEVTSLNRQGQRIRISVQGSGVCVSPDGYILTVAHVVDGKSCDVTFPKSERHAKKTYKAKVLADTGNNVESVAVLKISDKAPFAFVPVGERAPPIGSKVVVMGYPAGKWRITNSVVTSQSLMFQDQPGTHLTGIRNVIYPGNSGGALLSDNRVVGIASVSDGIPPEYISGDIQSPGKMVNKPLAGSSMGMFLHYRHVRDAYMREVQNKERKLEIVVLSAAWCPPCQTFKRDYKAGKIDTSRVKFTIVEQDLNGRWDISGQKMLKEYEMAGNKLTHFPTFWVRGTGTKWSGYAGKDSLLQKIGKFLVGVIHFPLDLAKDIATKVTGRPDDASYSVAGDLNSRIAQMPEPFSDEAPTPKLSPEPDPISENPEQIDWSNVGIVFLAAETDQDVVKGVLIKTALTRGKGPIERLVAEKTDGKAKLFLVSERIESQRFWSVANAAGVEPSPFYVVVLVKAQALGLKGLIVKRIERIVAAKLPGNVPIDVIFERAHGATYQSVQAALATIAEPYRRGDSVSDSGKDSDDDSEPKEGGDPDLAERRTKSVIESPVDSSPEKPEDDERFPWEFPAIAGIAGALRRAQQVRARVRDKAEIIKETVHKVIG